MISNKIKLLSSVVAIISFSSIANASLNDTQFSLKAGYNSKVGASLAFETHFFSESSALMHGVGIAIDNVKNNSGRYYNLYYSAQNYFGFSESYIAIGNVGLSYLRSNKANNFSFVASVGIGYQFNFGVDAYKGPIVTADINTFGIASIKIGYNF